MTPENPFAGFDDAVQKSMPVLKMQDDNAEIHVQAFHQHVSAVNSAAEAGDKEAAATLETIKQELLTMPPDQWAGYVVSKGREIGNENGFGDIYRLTQENGGDVMKAFKVIHDEKAELEAKSRAAGGRIG